MADASFEALPRRSGESFHPMDDEEEEDTEARTRKNGRGADAQVVRMNGLGRGDVDAEGEEDEDEQPLTTRTAPVHSFCLLSSTIANRDGSGDGDGMMSLGSFFGSDGTPPLWQRPVPPQLPYSAFPPMCLLSNSKHLTSGFPAVPPPCTLNMHPFATHDVTEEDWRRFLDSGPEDGGKSAHFTAHQINVIPLVTGMSLVTGFMATYAIGKWMEKMNRRAGTASQKWGALWWWLAEAMQKTPKRSHSVGWDQRPPMSGHPAVAPKPSPHLDLEVADSDGTSKLKYLCSVNVGHHPSWIEGHPSADGKIVVVKYDEHGKGQQVDEATCSSGGADPCTLLVKENKLQTKPGRDLSRQEASHPHQAVFNSLNSTEQELLVADLGTDKVWQHTKSANGHWTTRDFVTTETGSGPRHVATYGNTLYILPVLELTFTCGVQVPSADARQWLGQLRTGLSESGAITYVEYAANTNY